MKKILLWAAVVATVVGLVALLIRNQAPSSGVVISKGYVPERNYVEMYTVVNDGNSPIYSWRDVHRNESFWITYKGKNKYGVERSVQIEVGEQTYHDFRAGDEILLR